MEVARNFRPALVAHRFVAKDDGAKLDLLLDSPAAMVGEPGIVVADDPRPVEPPGKVEKQFARIGGKPLASEAVVEAVAKAVDPPRAGALRFLRERRQRRVLIIRGQELPQPREPARFFEVQVGKQERFARGPVERACRGRVKRFACERKGNHEAGLTPAQRPI
jgi:hypothetical protein